jgi:hypothetical protein
MSFVARRRDATFIAAKYMLEADNSWGGALASGTLTAVLSATPPSDRYYLIYGWGLALYDVDGQIWGILDIDGYYPSVSGGVRGFYVEFANPRRVKPTKTVKVWARQDTGASHTVEATISGVMMIT